MSSTIKEAYVTQFVTYIRDILHSEAVDRGMRHIHRLWFNIGIPPPYMDAERLAISIFAGVMTLVGYYILFGTRHRRRRYELLEELQEAAERVHKLEEKLAKLDQEGDEPKKQIRIWMDGAFDMMHYGHMNAFRQGKSLGTYLVVGVNDDESITTCKGAPPVMNDGTSIVRFCHTLE